MIEDILTDDADVLKAWGALYFNIAGVFAAQGKELYDEMETTLLGWAIVPNGRKGET